MFDHVQPTLCGEFLASFWHEGHQIGFNVQGNFGHGIVSRHLQVEMRLHGFTQNGQIPILNMPPVLPEVHDNAIGPGKVN